MYQCYCGHTWLGTSSTLNEIPFVGELCPPNTITHITPSLCTDPNQNHQEMIRHFVKDQRLQHLAQRPTDQRKSSCRTYSSALW